MNPNINNICSFPTSIAEGHLYQSFYHQRMGLLRLGLVSECRVTKNTANDTYFPILFFYFSNIIVERFKTTLTSDDAKQKKWFMIPKVASINFHIKIFIFFHPYFQQATVFWSPGLHRNATQRRGKILKHNWKRIIKTRLGVARVKPWSSV